MNRLVTGAVVAAAFAVANCIPTSLTLVHSQAAAHRAQAQAATSEQIVASARGYLGSPYATIGDNPSTGFSCIGFVHFIFAQNGVDVPYDIPMAWNSAPHVAFSDLLPGDILFYSNTVFAGLSHVGIYIGGGKMIGADNFQVGVTVDTITDSYWMSHYTGATRPLAALGTSPAPLQQTLATVDPTATPSPTPTTVQLTVQATAPAGTQLQANTANIGVFSGPGYTYTPLTLLSQSAVMVVVQAQDGWYDVRFHDAHLGNTFGWVPAALVRIATNARQQTPAFAAPAPSPVPQPPQAFSRAAATSSVALVVVAGPLNVRSGPGKQYKTVGFVRKGTRLTQLTQQTDWVRVSTDTGLVGWVDMAYVARADTPQYTPASSQTQQSTPPSALGTARVTATVLNVRMAPQETAHVVTVLFAGEVVPVLEQSNGWYEVRLKTGTVGWASGKWLVLSK